MAEFPLYSANRATVSAGCRPTSPTPFTCAVTSSSGTCAPPPVCRSPYVVPVKRCRHAFSATSRQLTCGCLNMRSLSSVKVDAVLSEFNDRDRPLDILCLTNAWGLIMDVRPGNSKDLMLKKRHSSNVIHSVFLHSIGMSYFLSVLLLWS